jgi:hypothetical protein
LRAAARCSSTWAMLSGIQRLPWPRIWAHIAAVKAVIFYPLLYAYTRMPFRELVGVGGLVKIMRVADHGLHGLVPVRSL